MTDTAAPMDPKEISIKVMIDVDSIDTLDAAKEALRYMQKELAAQWAAAEKMSAEHAAAIKRSLKTNETNEAHWRAELRTQKAIVQVLQETICHMVQDH